MPYIHTFTDEIHPKWLDFTRDRCTYCGMEWLRHPPLIESYTVVDHTPTPVHTLSSPAGLADKTPSDERAATGG
jgi:hypothetical protein